MRCLPLIKGQASYVHAQYSGVLTGVPRYTLVNSMHDPEETRTGRDKGYEQQYWRWGERYTSSGAQNREIVILSKKRSERGRNQERSWRKENSLLGRCKENREGVCARFRRACCHSPIVSWAGVLPPVFSPAAERWAAENEGQGELQEPCGKLKGFEQLLGTLQMIGG